jgi:7,8-dihydropterin-6-yl-methyl-4-(beta-D-ribofuranosyl)aminobenzene 5'-phosphate synthase
MTDNVCTVIIENTKLQSGLAAEHGLCILVEHRGQNILLDTGASPLFLQNADLLDKNLDTVDAAVLSHGHYDHTGGLTAYLTGLDKPPPIYAHPAVFAPHYAVRNNVGVDIGAPFTREDLLHEGAEIVETLRWSEIGDGVFVTGQVRRTTDFEDTGGPFFHDEAGRVPDLLSDDMGLVLDFGDRLWVLAGCAHSGIINILTEVREHLPNREIELVAGGFHLVNATESRIEKTIVQLKRFGVKKVVAGHCTGPAALSALAREYRDGFTEMSSGLVF